MAVMRVHPGDPAVVLVEHPPHRPPMVGLDQLEVTQVTAVVQGAHRVLTVHLAVAGAAVAVAGLGPLVALELVHDWVVVVERQVVARVATRVVVVVVAMAVVVVVAMPVVLAAVAAVAVAWCQLEQ